MHPNPLPRLDYQRIFASSASPSVAVGTDDNFTILDANDAYLQATHTQREAIVGQPFFDVFPENPSELGGTGRINVRSSLLRIRREGRQESMAVQKYDIRRPESSGGGFEERYWSPVHTPVFDADGQMVCIVLRVEDVTQLATAHQALLREGETMRLEILLRGQELQEANRQLREANEQFQAMYEQGLFAGRLRLDGTVIDVNRACLEICGFKRADVLGKPFWECGWWSGSAAVQAWVRDAVLQAVLGAPFRGQTPYFWADGSEHIADFACMPIKDAAGKVVVVVPTAMDITERLQAEQSQCALEAERRRAEALTEIDRVKTVFFSNVSHELRTPLTLTFGPLEELLAQATGENRDRLELIHRSALRSLKVVNNMLEFARVHFGLAQAVYEPTDLASLTRDLVSNFRSACQRSGLQLRVDLEPLPEAVFVDPQMWETIVLNLISNALKFTFEGQIHVSLTTDGPDAVLRVRDTGIGIAPSELPELFERFHRIENARSRGFGGAGIGLALVHELVRLHQGSIAVDSTPKRGTSFTVRMPLGCAHLPQAQIGNGGPRDPARSSGVPHFVNEALSWLPNVPPEAPEALGSGAAQARSRILIADDDDDMRAYLTRVLSPRFEVRSTADGQQAFRCALDEHPDLVLAEVMLPGLSGLELVKRLRSHEQLSRVPFLLLSARAGEEARIEGLKAGADDYLMKPLSARELVARVTGLLDLTALRWKSERRFLDFVNAAFDVVYRMSPDWTELRYVQIRNVILAEQGPSSTWLQHNIPDEDQALVKDAIARAIATKDRFELEHRVRRSDGSVGWTQSRAIPVFNHRGDIVEWWGMAVDTTERKLLEQLLRRTAAWWAAQKEAFQAAVNGAPLNAALDILVRAVREQMEHKVRCAFYLSNADNTVLRHVSGMPEDYARDIANYPIAADSPGCGLAVFSGQAVITPDTDKDPLWKDWLWLAQRHHIRGVWSFPVETSTGKMVGSFAIYHQEPRKPTPRDLELAAVLTHSAAIIISRYQEAEERACAAEALRLRDRQKDEFLAMLAHELRNPLAPICNATEVLSNRLAPDPAALSLLGMIKRQTSHLTRLVDDLLDVSRITQGRITLQCRPIDLASVVTQAIETVEPRLREKQHKLSVVSATGYEPIYVNGDFARLVQCVDNILTNAAKYTDAGGQIRVHTRAENSNAVIEISDTGAGIGAELLPRLFNLFVQSDRTLDRAQGGLGVGLAVVKRLVEMHEGAVAARSEGLGRGSTFEIRLPRVAKPEATRHDQHACNAAPRRVLVVDDNVDSANSLAMLLSVYGHVAQVAYSGKEALLAVASFLPDVALLDIGLPGMNGYELAQQLRSNPELAGVRLVALTGYGQAEDHQRARAAGFDDHLVKPVSFAALQQTFAHLLPDTAA